MAYIIRIDSPQGSDTRKVLVPNRPTKRQIDAFKRVYRNTGTKLLIQGPLGRAACDTHREDSLSHRLNWAAVTIVGGGPAAVLVCAFFVTSIPALMILGVLLGAGVAATVIRKIHAQREVEHMLHQPLAVNLAVPDPVMAWAIECEQKVSLYEARVVEEMAHFDYLHGKKKPYAEIDYYHAKLRLAIELDNARALQYLDDGLSDLDRWVRKMGDEAFDVASCIMSDPDIQGAYELKRRIAGSTNALYDQAAKAGAVMDDVEKRVAMRVREIYAVAEDRRKQEALSELAGVEAMANQLFIDGKNE